MQTIQLPRPTDDYSFKMLQKLGIVVPHKKGVMINCEMPLKLTLQVTQLGDNTNIEKWNCRIFEIHQQKKFVAFAMIEHTFLNGSYTKYIFDETEYKKTVALLKRHAASE